MFYLVYKTMIIHSGMLGHDICILNHAINAYCADNQANVLGMSNNILHVINRLHVNNNVLYDKALRLVNIKGEIENVIGLIRKKTLDFIVDCMNNKEHKNQLISQKNGNNTCSNNKKQLETEGNACLVTDFDRRERFYYIESKVKMNNSKKYKKLSSYKLVNFINKEESKLLIIKKGIECNLDIFKTIIFKEIDLAVNIYKNDTGNDIHGKKDSKLLNIMYGHVNKERKNKEIEQNLHIQKNMMDVKTSILKIKENIVKKRENLMDAYLHAKHSGSKKINSYNDGMIIDRMKECIKNTKKGTSAIKHKITAKLNKIKKNNIDNAVAIFDMIKDRHIKLRRIHEDRIKKIKSKHKKLKNKHKENLAIINNLNDTIHRVEDEHNIRHADIESKYIKEIETYEGEIQNYKDEIDDLYNNIEKYKEDADQLSNTIKSLEEDINGYKETISKNNEQISELNDVNGKYKTDISNLDGMISKYKTEINEINVRVASYSEQIEALNEVITENNSKLAIDAVKEDINANIKRMYQNLLNKECETNVYTEIERNLYKIQSNIFFVEYIFINTIHECLKIIVKDGTIENDERLINVIDTTLKDMERCSGSKFAKMCVTLEISKRYVKDMIKVKKILEMFRYYKND